MRGHPVGRRTATPLQLPPGGVLVVGASSSGVQIADELTRAGREVVLAVGRHTRMPRRYRGMDIFWWLERTGRLARTIDEVPDPPAARREPSMQLIGRGRTRSTWSLCKRRRPAHRTARTPHRRPGLVPRRPRPQRRRRRPEDAPLPRRGRRIRRTDRAPGAAGGAAGRGPRPARTGAHRPARRANRHRRARYRLPPASPVAAAADQRTRTATSSSTAASPPHPVSTSSASGFSTAATRASSTAHATTRRPSSGICSADPAGTRRDPSRTQPSRTALRTWHETQLQRCRRGRARRWRLHRVPARPPKTKIKKAPSPHLSPVSHRGRPHLVSRCSPFFLQA